MLTYKRKEQLKQIKYKCLDTILYPISFVCSSISIFFSIEEIDRLLVLVREEKDYIDNLMKQEDEKPPNELFHETFYRTLVVKSERLDTLIRKLNYISGMIVKRKRRKWLI